MALTNIENVLQCINRKYISLNNAEVAENNKLLKITLEKMITIMKNLDSAFKILFGKVYYGGSYYDDLKVGHADEFDLDLVLTIPKLCQKTKRKTCNCVELSITTEPGYLRCKIDEDHHQVLNQFVRDGYLQTDLILNWMKSLVRRALNELSRYENGDFLAMWLSESGPALILQVYGQFGDFNIDFVPAFQFEFSDWPTTYTSNNSGKHDFFIVPKKAKINSDAERYWRASFQQQERALICGKERLKPALRLLKKMRNNLRHVSISSYALKTIVLLQLNNFGWESSLQVTFLKLLKVYDDHLKQGKIPYYWQQNGDLLKHIDPETIRNHGNEISRKLFHLEKTRDPLVVAEIILKRGTREFAQFFDEYERGRNSSLIDRLSHISVNDNGAGQSGSQLNDQLQTTRSSGWGTTAMVVGGAAVLGMSLFAALRNNRNQD